MIYSNLPRFWYVTSRKWRGLNPPLHNLKIEQRCKLSRMWRGFWFFIFHALSQIWLLSCVIISMMLQAHGLLKLKILLKNKSETRSVVGVPFFKIWYATKIHAFFSLLEGRTAQSELIFVSPTHVFTVRTAPTTLLMKTSFTAHAQMVLRENIVKMIPMNVYKIIPVWMVGRALTW